MALITCPECHKRISETAVTCPSCGFALSADVVAKQKAKEQAAGCVVGLFGLGVVLFFVLMCSGVFSSGTSSTSSPATSSSPNDYDDSTDRYLKDRPSLRGFSDPDKERIIRAAKEFDARVKALERQRGF